MDNRIILYMNEMDQHFYYPFSNFEYIKVDERTSYDQIEVLIKLKNNVDLIEIYISKRYNLEDVNEYTLYNYHRDVIFKSLYYAFSETQFINLAILPDIIDKHMKEYTEQKSSK